MTFTFVILIYATILLAVSAISLSLLLRPRLSQYKIVKVSKIITISIGSGRITNGCKYALLEHRPSLLNTLIGKRVEIIQCYQRPTSSRWFQRNDHLAVPISVSNRLNGAVRWLEQWK